jgi:hypothetical protein
LTPRSCFFIVGKWPIIKVLSPISSADIEKMNKIKFWTETKNPKNKETKNEKKN